MIEDASNQQEVYKILYTQGFDWAEMLRTQTYRELSADEFRQNQAQPNTTAVDLRFLKRYLRFEITQQKSTASGEE